MDLDFLSSLGLSRLEQDVLTGAVIGLLPAIVARYRGKSFLAWWAFGALLFVAALPLSFLPPKDGRPVGKVPRPITAFVLLATAGIAFYILSPLFLPTSLACADKGVVATAAKIIKDELLDGAPTSVELHLIATASATEDKGIVCSATAEIRTAGSSESSFREVQYSAFLQKGGEDYQVVAAFKR